MRNQRFSCRAVLRNDDYGLGKLLKKSKAQQTTFHHNCQTKYLKEKIEFPLRYLVF